MEPQRIARYTVDRLLGVGGMGEVYLAEDHSLHRKVAIKLLPERFTTDEERVRRFQREARAASALNHPNIITIYEVGTEDRRHYIAAEFIEGETLRTRIAGPATMTIAEILDVGIGVANALSAAHEAGILHRDIKPENIMLRPDGYVKVLDFGLAKLVDSDTKLKDSNTGAVMGTLMYLSPEQARGIYPDARADVYSLGAVIYEMITRRPPIADDNFLELAHSIANVDPPLPSELASNVPPELDRIVMKALSKDRTRRHQTARELLGDLKALRQELEFENKLNQLAPEARQSTPPLAFQKTALLSRPPEESPIRRHRVPLIVAAAAIVIALAVYAAIKRDVLFGSHRMDSVAVLPFVNASGNPDSEYLSDGISESIIDSLSQLPNLQVVARSTSFRYKGKSTDPLAVGRELRVEGVVTGQLEQRGDTIIIRAELTDVRRGTQVWGEQYNRKLADVLDVQRDMSREISNQLRSRLSGEERALLARRGAESNEAFTLYLKGRYFRNRYNEQAVRRAIDYFNQAISVDPTYALAYAGLADAYYGLSNLYMAPREAMPRAREAAKRALALDDSLAQAHTSLALVLAWYDWDFKGGEREFRRAIELNPNDADAHRLYGDFLTAIGQYDRALTEKKAAEQLDPLSVMASWDVGRTLFHAGRLTDASEQTKRTIELDPYFGFSYFLQAQIAMKERRYPDAVTLTEKTMSLAGRTPLLVATWGYVSAKAGNRASAQSAMKELRARPTYTLPLFLARIHCGLGEYDAAMKWLEHAYADRSESIVWLKVDPYFEEMRGNPKFQALIRRVGL